jgi:hypothetical protein
MSTVRPGAALERTSFAASIASLFASGGTLVCCAIPALMVSIGAGAALAGVISAVPQVIWLSAHKGPLFAVGALLLLAAGILQWKARRAPCPADPTLAAVCTRMRRLSRRVYALSVAIYAAGAYFAFVAPWIGGTG